jgi:hypothetical protein
MNISAEEKVPGTETTENNEKPHPRHLECGFRFGFVEKVPGTKTTHHKPT